MERLIYDDLLRWKKRNKRKPVLLDGARQTGKTFLIDELFGPREFRKVVKLDFLINPNLCALFQDSIHPDEIVANIAIALGEDFDPKQDLLFFDEIGECQRALDSLKYFAELRPDIYVCASGSNIGLTTSFPVGKVEIFELFPLCFEEFLMAGGNSHLTTAFRERKRNRTVHLALWDRLREYYFVGGMPSAVASWYEHSDNMHTRVSEVNAIHDVLLQGYVRDFGKYSGKENALHIETVFLNVPRQLSSYTDTSVRRFKFGNVIERKNRYRDLRGPIDWLEHVRLIWKCSPISSDPVAPLLALAKENLFKVFLFDIGMLGRLLELTYADHIHEDLTFKGFFAENFVATEYRSRVGYPMYGWQKNESEIEFLHRVNSGSICPVEVKSGRRTRAKSLRSYIDRYEPEFAIKFANVHVPTLANGVSTWPLYDVQFLGDM